MGKQGLTLGRALPMMVAAIVQQDPHHDMHHGFSQTAERALPDLGGVGHVLRHIKTGAEVVVVHNDDVERAFAISLRTHPTCDNGIAHVLEHLIFRGSTGFPQSNLYTALMQGTLATALNATTKADHTMFHFASADEADFATLADVMLDAVFAPLLRDVDVAQERAVVINEMAGHHAVPAHQIMERLRRKLFPGSVYAVDTGGTPADIATLDQDAVEQFHSTHYHPGNAQIFLWGRFHLTARLDQLHALLDRYAVQQTVLPQVPCLPDALPCSFETYPAFSDAPYLTGLGWHVTAGQNDRWQAASDWLFAAPDGPLRAGLQSGGHRLLGTGFTQDTPLPTVELSFAGPDTAPTDWITSEIEKTLARLPSNWEKAAADVFALKLGQLSAARPGPAGLRAFGLIADGWQHGRDPLALLDISARVDTVRRDGRDDPDRMIRCMADALLAGSPSATLRLTPDGAPLSQSFKRDIPAQRADPDRTTPCVLPAPPVVDIFRDSGRIKTEYSAGVLYVEPSGPPLARVEMALSLAALSPDEAKLLPILLAVLRHLPLAQDVHLTCWTDHNATSRHYLSIAGVALPDRAQGLLHAVTAPIDWPLPGFGLLHPILAQARAVLLSHIAASGHLHCDTRLRATGNDTGLCDEWINGISQIRAFDQALAQPPESLGQALAKLRGKIMQDAPRTLAISGIDPALAPGLPSLPRPTPATIGKAGFPLAEALVTSAANFTTGQSLALTDPAGAILAAHMLETGWLWDAVRVAGAAYSVRATFDHTDALLRMISIRDPSASATLAHFGTAPLWLRRHAQGDLLNRCRIATLGRILRPIRPEDRLSTALRRHLSGETSALRQQNFEQLQAVDRDRMHALADELDAGLPTARTVVLGPQAGLESLVQERRDIIMA